MLRSTLVLFGFLSALGGVTACSGGPQAGATTGAGAAPATAQASGEIVVFAASSLTDAFREIGTAFEQANPQAHLTFNFGASSQLRAQLEQGARADIFASADQTQMDAARRADALVGPDQIVARNRLVIITPKDNPRTISSLADLAGEGLRLVGSQPSVPIGQYTQAMLEKASADPAYGGEFMAKVERNVVSREDNVRQVVGKVQLGEADAAVVYSSDLTPQVRDQVRQFAVPDSLNVLTAYPVAVARGNNAAGGEAFAAYLVSPAAQDILGQWGFVKIQGGP